MRSNGAIWPRALCARDASALALSALRSARSAVRSAQCAVRTPPLPVRRAHHGLRAGGVGGARYGTEHTMFTLPAAPTRNRLPVDSHEGRRGLCARENASRCARVGVATPGAARRRLCAASSAQPCTGRDSPGQLLRAARAATVCRARCVRDAALARAPHIRPPPPPPRRYLPAPRRRLVAATCGSCGRHLLPGANNGLNNILFVYCCRRRWPLALARRRICARP